ncbi:MAG TPA: CDP-alcohol phosphatidyltransferase family protein [Syntrophorhabdaceae bacterium]|nr:CDP-alcohol phosphatidyltransferase family protein [Syntrophorhabdaceae bacterium]HPU30641.1 CDP-alcohol phosphatidyltransferase family protein [Syntrophorhabdaceae bacterium]
MNIPNLFSVFRLFITIFFIIAINENRFNLALCLFIAQGLSDLLDGFLARIMKAKTYLGAILDPMADKVMLASSYIILTLKGFIPLWVTLTVISRDFLIAGGFILLYLISNRLKPSPSVLSKLTTLFQIITIIYILWSDKKDYKEPLFYITFFFTILSGIHYLIRGLKALKQSENI